MKYILTIFAILAAAIAPAHAINKCTSPDGKVTYQETACPNSAKESQTIAAQANGTSNSAHGKWEFIRSHDDMTQKTACLIRSSVSSAIKPMPDGFYPVHAVLVIDASGTPTFGLRTSEEKLSFHNNISGMGVKTNSSPFTPITVKASSHVVGISDSTAFTAQLEKSKELQARVRFWPYEQLYDIIPIPMNGFKSALAQAKACAATLDR